MTLDERNAIGRIQELACQLYPGPGFLPLIQRLRPRIAPFHRLLGLFPEGASVLDIGCGAGLLLGLLAADGKLSRGVGFDASKPAIALAEQMRQILPLDQQARLSFCRIDVEEPWPAGHFDVVTLIDVLHHISPLRQRAVLGMAFQKTAPGGLLVYKDMAPRPLFCGLMNRLHDLVLARQWIHYLPVEQAERWVTEERASVEIAGRCRMLWYQHEYRVFRRPADLSGISPEATL